jgi:hypothetical protein
MITTSYFIESPYTLRLLSSYVSDVTRSLEAHDFCMALIAGYTRATWMTTSFSS